MAEAGGSAQRRRKLGMTARQVRNDRRTFCPLSLSAAFVR